MGLLGDIRAGERTSVLLAFATVGSIMAAHELLETARDAVFLSSLPASKLPWVYLIIAAIGMGISLGRQSRARVNHRLALMVVASAVVTAGFWLALRWPGAWTPYALYVWTGLFGTLVITEFWIVAGSLFTPTQAKRLYRFIGLGAILGAIAGSLLARALVEILPVESLVLSAAIILGLSGLGPIALHRAAGDSLEPSFTADRHPVGECLRRVGSHPYTLRIGIVMILAVMMFTTLDYVFKSVVAAHFAPAELASFFATFNLAVNAGSLIAQFFLVRWLLTHFGVTRAISLLPLLIFGGAVGLAAGGGLLMALLMRGADGSLRHSLHRTVSELLFVPMPNSLRRAAKMFIDVMGHRGAQAMASLGILAAVRWLEPSIFHFALATAALAMMVILVAFGIQKHYLNVFRNTLRDQSVQTSVAFPALNMSSLESLIRGLNSPRDEEVLAALELLDHLGKTSLVPDLILYHPSRAVVLGALDLFVRDNRASFLPIAERLMRGDDAAIRAAALQAHSKRWRDDAVLRAALDDGSVDVRAAALVELASGAAPSTSLDARLEAITGGDDVEAQLALARAIGKRPSDALALAMLELARVDDPAVRTEAARAMARYPDPRFIDVLIPMLGVRELRSAARAAIVRIGSPALARLDAALDDPRLPRTVRHHIPRTMSRFEAGACAPLMLARLPDEPDGVVRYKLLRGLGRLRAENLDLELDEQLLARSVSDGMTGAFRAVHWKLTIADGQRDDPARRSPVGSLLASVLRDREANAIERVFRLLGLLYPGEDFEPIHRGLRNSDRRTQSSSRELIAGLIQPPLRDCVLALVDDTADGERLAESTPYYDSAAISYQAALGRILDGGGEALRCIAAYHAAELGLVQLRTQIDDLGASASPLVRIVGERAAWLFQGRVADQVAYV